MLRFPIALIALVASLPAFAQPSPVVGADWRVTRIAGAPLPPGAAVTIAFSADGRVAGRSGCNRYTGAVEINGERLTFGPLAGTRMACQPPLMAVESRFLEALRNVDRWRLQRGTLVLAGPDGREIRARRAARQR